MDAIVHFPGQLRMRHNSGKQRIEHSYTCNYNGKTTPMQSIVIFIFR